MKISLAAEEESTRCALCGDDIGIDEHRVVDDEGHKHPDCDELDKEPS